MKSTDAKFRLLRKGWVVAALLVVLAATTLAQGNVTNTGAGSIINTGTLKLKGTLTPATQSTIAGTVEYNNAGTQTVTPLTYTNLTVSGGTGDKTLGAGTTNVGGALTVNNTANAFVVGGQTLNLTGATPVTVSTGSFNAASGTVNYSGGVAQLLYATTYQNLGTSGGAGADKTAGAVTFTGTFTNASSTIVDFGANTVVGTGATFANSGTLRSTGTVTVDATAVIGGTFEYYNSTTSQSVAPAFYTNLTLSGGAVAVGQKNFSSLVKISGVYTASGANRNYGTGTIEFDGAGVQTITGESNYYAVTLSAAGGKTLTSAMTLTNAFSHGGGQLDINAGGSLALGTTASFATLNINGTGALTGGSGLATFTQPVALTAAGGNLTAGAGGLSFSNTLSNAGTVTVGAGRAMTLSNSLTNTGSLGLNATSTVTYNQAGAQAVVAANYGNLALAGGNTKTLNGAINIATSLATSGTTNVTIAGGGVTTLTGTATANLDGDLTTTGTFDASAAGTTTFSGGAQNISGTAITFTGLTLNGSADKASTVDLTVNGAFTPTQGIAMNSSKTLTIGSSGTVGTYGALKEVKGLMTVNAPSATTYKMNNEYTSVAFTNAEVSRTYTLNNQPATAPFAGYSATTDVNRKITATYSNWTAGSATLQIAYRYGERPSTLESSLRYFRNDPSVGTDKVGTGFTISRTASSIADAANTDLGRLSLQGIQPTAGAGSAYTKVNSADVVVMSARSAAFVTIAAAGDFNLGSTWDEGTVPAATDDAIINNTGITLASGASNTIKSLAINASSDLTLSNGTGTMTVTNGVTNSGSLTVGTTRILDVTGTFTNGGSLTNNGTVTVQ